MATTYKLIEAKTLGSAVTSVTFSSIPNTYTDLNLLMSIRDDNVGSIGSWTTLEFNGSVLPSGRFLFAAGSGSPSSGTTQKAPLENGGSSTSNTFANASIYFPNYANTSYNKSYSVDGVTENNATEAYTALVAGLVSTTSAISSIKITSGAANFAVNSTFYLYGISNS